MNCDLCVTFFFLSLSSCPYSEMFLENHLLKTGLTSASCGMYYSSIELSCCLLTLMPQWAIKVFPIFFCQILSNCISNYIRIPYIHTYNLRLLLIAVGYKRFPPIFCEIIIFSLTVCLSTYN